MLRDLLEAAPYLAAIGAGVLLLAILRDPAGADEHDLGDYYQPAEPTAEADEAADPGPGSAAGRLAPDAPVFDEMAARVYVPLDDEAVRALAAEWLEEFGAKARAELELAR